MRYDFECSAGHVFEVDLPSSKANSKLRCKYKNCKKLSVKVWLSPRASRQAKAFEPTLLYINAAGDVINPGRNNPDHLPKRLRDRLSKQGYKQIEITTFRQYEQVRKQITKVDRIKAEKYTSLEQEVYDHAIKQAVDDLRRGGEVEFPNPDGSSRIVKIPPLEKMHPQARQFAEYAIKQVLDHKFTPNNPNPYIESFENDNLSYRDADTEWHQRRV